MARIRTIKPSFWTDEDLSSLSLEAHYLAAALLNYADDEGYFNANPGLVKASCCPLRDSVNIHGALTELANIRWIELGRSPDGKTYGRIRTFLDHQVINRPQGSKIKQLSIEWMNAHGAFSESSVQEGNKEWNKEEEKEKDSRAASPQPSRSRRNGEYAFRGHVVKLTPPDMARWEKAYNALDVTAELTCRDDWLSSDEATDKDRKDWFISTSNWLAARHKARLAQREKGTQPEPKWKDPLA